MRGRVVRVHVRVYTLYIYVEGHSGGRVLGRTELNCRPRRDDHTVDGTLGPNNCTREIITVVGVVILYAPGRWSQRHGLFCITIARACACAPVKRESER